MDIFSSGHQRDFLWQPMREDAKTHSRTLCRERVSQNTTSLSGPFLRRPGNSVEEGRKECWSQREWGTPRAHGPLNQLSVLHMGPQSLGRNSCRTGQDRNFWQQAFPSHYLEVRRYCPCWMFIWSREQREYVKRQNNGFLIYPSSNLRKLANLLPYRCD